MIRPDQFTGKNKILVINRSAISVRIARCSIDSPVLSGETDVLCIDNPICDVIIGNVEGCMPIYEENYRYNLTR